MQVKVRKKTRRYHKFLVDKTLIKCQVDKIANREAKNAIAILRVAHYKDNLYGFVENQHQCTRDNKVGENKEKESVIGEGETPSDWQQSTPFQYGKSKVAQQSDPIFMEKGRGRIFFL